MLNECSQPGLILQIGPFLFERMSTRARSVCEWNYFVWLSANAVEKLAHIRLGFEGCGHVAPVFHRRSFKCKR